MSTIRDLILTLWNSVLPCDEHLPLLDIKLFFQYTDKRIDIFFRCIK